jgi:two-component system, NtrC family, response regulator HydG
VSRRHVALDVEGGRVRVSDLGSKNGTRINGVKVIEAWVQGGETIQAGSTLFQLDRQSSGKKVALSPATSWGRMIGASTEMRRLYPLCEKLAQSDVPVIIEGDPGTGKELLAECLHEQGPRANGPFVVLDCTAVPAPLLESELLGYVASARPGATEGRPGVIERAHGGTLLINEVAELDLALQVQLLNILERRSVKRLGSDVATETDFRLLVSTRSDLDREVAAGRFRDELLHRIAVARIELPPLRRRKGDVLLLARHFCQELGGSEQALQQALRLGWDEYAWPGNVRELRSTVARHLALGELAELSVDDEPQGEEPVSVDQIIEQALTLPLGEARQRVVVEFERRYVRRVLDRHSGNVTNAAESAGVARRYFQILKARLEKRRKEP